MSCENRANQPNQVMLTYGGIPIPEGAPQKRHPSGARLVRIMPDKPDGAVLAAKRQEAARSGTGVVRCPSCGREYGSQDEGFAGLRKTGMCSECQRHFETGEPLEVLAPPFLMDIIGRANSGMGLTRIEAETIFNHHPEWEKHLEQARFVTRAGAINLDDAAKAPISLALGYQIIPGRPRVSRGGIMILPEAIYFRHNSGEILAIVRPEKPDDKKVQAARQQAIREWSRNSPAACACCNEKKSAKEAVDSVLRSGVCPDCLHYVTGERSWVYVRTLPELEEIALRLRRGRDLNQVEAKALVECHRKAIHGRQRL